MSAYTRIEESDEAIWKGIRKRTIRLRVQQFLFKAIHNTPMIGDKWSHIQGYEGRGVCNQCGTLEDMSHILLTCREIPVALIWGLAKKLWPHTEASWPEITLGNILRCSNMTAQMRPHRTRNRREWTPDLQKGASRLLQISI